MTKKTALTIALFFTALNLIAQVEPYLSTPTSSSIWISWRTSNDTESKVEYGLTADNLEFEASGSFEKLDDDYIWHTTKLTNLSADTRYFYRTISGSEVSEIHRFKTQPTEGTKNGHYRFAIVGDHQVMSDDRYESLLKSCKQKAIDRFATSDSDTLVEDHLNLMICDGDQVDVGTLEQYKELHFGQSRPLMSNIPIMGVLGNHEYYGDSGLANYFSHYVYHDISYKGIVGNHGEEYYAFQVANILFVMLNSNLGHNQEQFNWLEDIVNASNSDPTVDWLFAVNHHCFLNEQMPGDGISAVRDGFASRLVKSPKYAMHITGHAHLYARGSIKNHPCHVVINGGASWDQYWGQTSSVDYSDVQKTIERQIYQIVDIDLDAREMNVQTWSNGTNLTPGFREDELIDEFYFKLDAVAPEKPSIINSLPEDVTLPFSFTGSAYTGQEAFNSVEFQIAGSDAGFEDPEYSYKTDYENVYLSSGEPDYNPTDQNEGLNLFNFTLESEMVVKGTKNIRVRYRDKSLRWSEWSESLAFTTTNGKPAPRKCPVLRYKLDGDASEDLGSGLDGSIGNGVTFTNDAEKNEVAGFNNSGMITISSGSTENLNLPENEISVSCWVKLNSTDDWGGFVGLFQDNGSYEKGWLLGSRGNAFSFALTTNGTALNYLTDNASLSTGVWYLLVGTYNGTTQKLYINGELKASSLKSGVIVYPPTGWFQIGSYKDDNEDFRHDGQLSDIIIWERAITLNEIKNIYQNTIPPCVDFTADKLNLSVNGQVQFAELCQFNPQNFSWEFEGAEPHSSAEESPLVNYNKMGAYNVKLVAENTHGKDSLTKTAYINVGTVGVDAFDMNLRGVKIYPNPANDILNVEVEDKYYLGCKISVSNMNGVIVYENTLSPHLKLHSINIENLSAGMYFVKITDKTELPFVTKRLIRE